MTSQNSTINSLENIDEDEFVLHDDIITINKDIEVIDYNQIIFNDEWLYGYISNLLLAEGRIDAKSFQLDRHVHTYLKLLNEKASGIINQNLVSFPKHIKPVIQISKHIFVDDDLSASFRFDPDQVEIKSLEELLNSFNQDSSSFYSYNENSDKKFQLFRPFSVLRSNNLVRSDRNIDCIYMYESSKSVTVYDIQRSLGRFNYTIPNENNKQIELYKGDELNVCGFFHEVDSKLSSFQTFHIKQYIDHLNEFKINDHVQIEIHDFIDSDSESSIVRGTARVEAISESFINLQFDKKKLIFNKKLLSHNKFLIYGSSYSNVIFNKTQLLKNNVLFLGIEDLSWSECFSFCSLSPQEHVFALIVLEEIDINEGNLTKLINIIPHLEKTSNINFHLQKLFNMFLNLFKRKTSSKQFLIEPTIKQHRVHNAPFFLSSIQPSCKKCFDSLDYRMKMLLASKNDQIIILNKITLTITQLKHDLQKNKEYVKNIEKFKLTFRDTKITKHKNVFFNYHDAFMFMDENPQLKDTVLVIVPIDNFKFQDGKSIKEMAIGYFYIVFQNKNGWDINENETKMMNKIGFQPIQNSNLEDLKLHIYKVSERLNRQLIYNNLLLNELNFSKHLINPKPQYEFSFSNLRSYEEYIGGHENVTEEIGEFGIIYKRLEENIEEDSFLAINNNDEDMLKIFKTHVNGLGLKLTKEKQTFIMTAIENEVTKFKMEYKQLSKESKDVTAQNFESRKILLKKLQDFKYRTRNNQMFVQMMVMYSLFLIFIQMSAFEKPIITIENKNINLIGFPLKNNNESLLQFMASVIEYKDKDGTELKHEEKERHLKHYIENVIETNHRIKYKLERLRSKLQQEVKLSDDEFIIWNTFRPFLIKTLDVTQIGAPKDASSSYFAAYFISLVNNVMLTKTDNYKKMHSIHETFEKKGISFWTTLRSHPKLNIFLNDLQRLRQYHQNDKPYYLLVYSDERRPSILTPPVINQTSTFRIENKNRHLLSNHINFVGTIQHFQSKNKVFINDVWLRKIVFSNENDENVWNELSDFINEKITYLIHSIGFSLEDNTELNSLRLHVLFTVHDRKKISMLLHQSLHKCTEICGKIVNEIKYVDWKKEHNHQRYMDAKTLQEIKEIRNQNEIFDLIDKTDLSDEMRSNLLPLLQSFLKHTDRFASQHDKSIYILIYLLIKFMFCLIFALNKDYDFDNVFDKHIDQNIQHLNIGQTLIEGICKRVNEHISTNNVHLEELENEFENTREENKQILMKKFKDMEDDVRKMKKRLLDLNVLTKEDIKNDKMHKLNYFEEIDSIDAENDIEPENDPIQDDDANEDEDAIDDDQ